MAEQQIAQRKWSPTELRRLIELGRDGRFGFENVNAAVLNSIYFLCRELQLKPGEEVIAYQNRPYVNERGVLTLTRRHPEYRGFSQVPLTKEEKEAWGYDPSDIVVATTVRTALWGDITQHGKVTAAEVNAARSRQQANPRNKEPIGTAPVEMASKRSLMRAAQAALGYDAVPTEEEVLARSEVVVTELDHAQVKENADKYDAIFHNDDDDDQARPVVEGQVRPVGAEVE